MPVYEYVCENGHREDRVKSFKLSDKKLENDRCKKCGRPSKLVPSRTGSPILVGRGFHANDYNSPTRT